MRTVDLTRSDQKQYFPKSFYIYLELVFLLNSFLLFNILFLIKNISSVKKKMKKYKSIKRISYNSNIQRKIAEYNIIYILCGDLKIMYYCIFLSKIQYVMFLNIFYFYSASLSVLNFLILSLYLSLYSARVPSLFFFILFLFYFKVKFHYRIFIIYHL